jgi:hypothetical protein
MVRPIAARWRRAAAWSLALSTVVLLSGCMKHPPRYTPYPWAHINVLIPGRAVGYTAPNTPARQAYNEWIAAHANAVETGMDRFGSRVNDLNCPDLKRLSPTIKTIGYENDLTMPQLPEFADLPEDFYLHFSEDTRLEWAGVTMDIPGCPTASPATRASRVQIYDGQIKWLPHLGCTEWRRWYADHLIAEMTRNIGTGADNPIDILELDEHFDTIADVMRLYSLTSITLGGGIREYDGLVPSIVRGVGGPIDAPWHADLIAWLTYLQGRLASVNKSAQINVGEYFAQPGYRAQVMAIRGAIAEMVQSPFHNAIFNPTLYQQVIDLIAQLTAVGGTINLQPGAFSAAVPANYTAGNYGGPLERAKMWNLAGYYIVKEAPGQSGVVYFNPQIPDTTDFEAYKTEWLPAYEKDVGLPLGPAFAFQEGIVPGTGLAYEIFGRKYSKALVLVRTRDDWHATDYGDVTAATIRLAESMAMLEPDGTISPPMDSVLVRNAEAVILFPAPSVGRLIGGRKGS